MDAALALGEAARGTTAPNPNVGAVLVKDGAIIGRGATGPGGRPHAEAVALTEAGEATRGATLFVTLEPCAEPGRGPACADALVTAGIARVVAAIGDPHPRVNGAGFVKLLAAGISVETGPGADAAARSMEGFLTRQRSGRPFVTLKLALSIDGCLATSSGESKWITGGEARADVHRERARADMVLVGRGTLDADAPRLETARRKAVLTSEAAPVGWEIVKEPEAIARLEAVDSILLEGGAGAAAAFLAADLVDRLLVYRAPILLGGRPGVGDFGLASLAAAHGRWRRSGTRPLGADMVEIYERVRP